MSKKFNASLSLSLVLLCVFSFAITGNKSYAASHGAQFEAALAFYDKGEYIKAENALNDLLRAEPGVGAYHKLRGDVFRRTGRLKDAIYEYDRAKQLGMDDNELHKGYATAYRLLREYVKAEAEYKRALEIKPDDREAAEDLDALQKRRGFKVKLMAGGSEADYTKRNYEVSAAFSGFLKTDINAGYSYADQIFYTRDKIYANAYYFFEPTSYVKSGVSRKDYNYPVDPALQAPNPDSNSYDMVYAAELEVSHWFTPKVRVTGGYEFFRPNFFHDRGTSVINHKVSGDAYYITGYDPLRLKAMFSVLRDPDPSKTFIKGRGLNMPLGQFATATSVVHQTQALAGFGAELQYPSLSVDLKYMPNRDLDSSYSYSIFAGLGYDFTDKINGRIDYLHDAYSNKSIYAGKTANVYMLSVMYAVSPYSDVGLGYKRIDIPNRIDNAFFVNLTLKTGLTF